MRRRFFSAISVCALVMLAGASLTAAAGVATADPSPTLTLTGGPSGQANSMWLQSVSSSGIVYAVSDPATGLGDTTYLGAADGTTSVLTAPFDQSSNPTLAGDILGSYDSANQVFVYRNVEGTLSGTASVTATSFVGVSPDGYFSKGTPDGVNLHLFDTAVADSTTTDLGAVPGNPVQVQVTPGTQGALVETAQQQGGWGPRNLYYRSYGADGTYVPLADNLPLYGLPALGPTSAAWLENPGVLTVDDANFSFADTTLVRINLDGSGRTSIPAPNVDQIAIAAGLVGLLSIGGPAETFSTVPLVGGTATVAPEQVSWGMGSTGDAFVVIEPGSPATAGIYRRTSAADAGTQLVPAGAATLQATSVAVAPGRAAWVDNGIGANVWSRDLALDDQSPPDVSAAAPLAIAPAATQQPISASGGRVAYFTQNPAGGSDLWLRNPDGTTQKLSSANDSYATVTVSGTRVLQNNSDGSAVLYDVAHHTRTAFPAASSTRPMSGPGLTPYQLAGDDLAFVDPDGSVWVEDLATEAKTEVSAPVLSAGQWTQGNVAIAGNNVAWLVWVCSKQDQYTSKCIEASAVQYRNFRTMAPAYTLDGVDSPDFTLSENYLAFRGYVGSDWTVQVNPLYSSVVETVAPLYQRGLFPHYSLSGSVLAWVGTDGLPHVQALDQLPAPPRYLGNGIAATNVIGDGAHSWTGDFATSASLSRCSVTIYQQQTTVRTVVCDPTLMTYGEAIVTWDGKDADGKVLPPGSYAWVLNASNAEGALLDADGSSREVAGQIDVTSASTGGGGGGGGGGGVGGGSASGTLPAGGTLWSGGDPDQANPISVGVTTPAGGTVSISTQVDGTPEPGDRGIETFTISAPAASAAQPLQLMFKVYLGDLPPGSVPTDVQIFRDGTPIAACASGSTATTASPDPCIVRTSVGGNVASFTVLSSHASSWQVETNDVGRIGGADRFATAAGVSAATYPSGGAGAVVLASADAYPDALVGAPLAARHNAPILLTSGSQLPQATKAELLRVLAPGGTVYVLGGTVAVPASVEAELVDLGYHTTRLGGVDRFATATAVADALGDPSTVLLASGRNFPDALAAGPAAAARGAAVLLTDNGTMPAATSGYLAAHATTVYAIGGPAAQADPQANTVVGADRWATAAAVATTFFTSPTTAGIASGENYPDALAAGAMLARSGAPLLLTGAAQLPPATAEYVSAMPTGSQLHVFGGFVAVSLSVQQAIAATLPN